jgi:hypothetical protein
MHKACIIASFLVICLGTNTLGAELHPPQGIVGSIDDSSHITIEWVYHGFRDTTYFLHSGIRLKAIYISRREAGHKLAGHIVLSDERQWIAGCSIWVQKGLDCSDLFWLENASVRVWLCRDETGQPGDPLAGPIDCRPADSGIPPDGGYLEVEFDAAVPLSSANSVWIVVEWPPEFPSSVRIGVDDQPPGFNAAYLDASQPDPTWETWIDHNPMFSLVTLRYAEDCRSASDPGALDNAPESFLVEKSASVDGVAMADDSFCALIPGMQTFFSDAVGYANYTYEYTVRATKYSDTSTAASLIVRLDPPFDCAWTLPESTLSQPGDQIHMTFGLRNFSQATIVGRYLFGWLRPEGSTALGRVSEVSDSLPLWADLDSVAVPSGDTGFFELFLRDREDLGGRVRWTSVFAVNDHDNHYTEYKLFGDIEFSEMVGVENHGVRNDESAMAISIFPNPGNGQSWIEIRPPIGANYQAAHGELLEGYGTTEYIITTYDILGREVRRFTGPGLSQSGETCRVLFDGLDNNGNPLPSALYLIKVQRGRWSTCRKFILLR